MKKNKMMRAASALLVAVLLTTCAVSGTFAKYVTSDDASDSARVAKFGVVVTADGTLFGKTYLNATTNTPGADDATPDTITVKSSDTDKVVAPGTKNDTGFALAVTGTPEVDVNVVVEVKGLAPNGTTEYDTVKDISLVAGTYSDVTTGTATDEFNLTTDYYPVKFTLTQTKDGGTTKLVDAGKLSAVETALEGLSRTYEANVDLAKEIGTLNLTWAWDYGAAAVTSDDPWTLNVEYADKADTLLGALAAAPNGDPLVASMSGKYNLETGLEISILVEQID